MKKQVLFFLLILMPLMASADPVEIDGIYYNLVKKVKQAEVTYSGTAGQYNGDIVIPEVLTYEGVSYSVTSIGESAFFGCSSLTGVSIPNSVTNIGNSAFLNCKAITSIMIPNSVTSIEVCAFQGCTGLTSITIGNGVTSIGEHAFHGCTGLSLVNIKDIAAWCNITFGSGESNPLFHAHHLFLDSIEIKNLVIPNNVTCIGERAFEYCSYLTSVTIPNSVTSIGKGAFTYCSSMTSLEIPNSVTSIGVGAFSCCTGLTSVDIPNSVISLDGFSHCTGLTSVTIPNSVTSIGDYAFSGCSSLTDISIPNSVTSIGKFAFEECSGLTSITIGNGVTSIEMYAFYNCSELTSVTIPNSVNSIENCTFEGCTSLESIIIGKGVNNIGNFAFANCKNLTEVKCFAKNVPSTSDDAFDQSMIDYCTLYVPLKSLSNYQATEPWSRFGMIKSLTDGILFADDAVEALCLANWDANNDGELGMDEAADVTDLGSGFANNTDITSFDELQYFTGLISIGEQAFYYCSNLNSIIIPDNVTTIGNRAFYVCSGLKSLRIPANVLNIEDRAFAYCSGLETIEVDENNQYYDSRSYCNALIQTNSNTLLVGCKNTEIPSSVKVIAEGAFRGCTELASIEIPDGVTTIGASAFRGCTGLTSVTLPSTITSIGNYAFSAVDEVYNLTSVTVGMTTPVAITSQVFPNRANSTLYVPKGSRAAYKAADYWKEFKNIVELNNGIPVKCETPVITLLANGKIKVESATEGAICNTTITASNADPLTDGEISINTPLIVYTVTAYATAEGFGDSEVATATFRYEKAEGDINGDGNLNISDVVQLVNMILSK